MGCGFERLSTRLVRSSATPYVIHLRPTGRLVRVVLGCVTADRPAAVGVTGGPHFKAKVSPCLRCTISADEIVGLRDAPLRDSHAHNLGTLAQITSVPAAIESDKQRWNIEHRAATDAVINQKRKAYPNYRRDQARIEATIFTGNISALALIPGYDKFGCTIFDPMHSLLEGCCKTYFWQVIVLGVHGSEKEEAEGGTGSEAESEIQRASREQVEEAEKILAEVRSGRVEPRTPAQIQKLEAIIKRFRRKPRTRQGRMLPADIRRMQDLLRLVLTPSSVPRLHPQFGSPSAGIPTADHWRTFATVYGPLIIPQLFIERGPSTSGRKGNPHLSPDDRDAMMTLFEIISLALRSTISDTQVDYLETLIVKWQRTVYNLHDTLKTSTNLHVLTHLCDDIRRFGPVYGWWTFLIERLNYIIKNTNRSGGNAKQAQVVAFRALLRTRSVRIVGRQLLHTLT